MRETEAALFLAVNAKHTAARLHLPLTTAADSIKQDSDLLLLLNFIPSKLYPLASPADSRSGIHIEHTDTYMGTERHAGGESVDTGTPLCYACKLSLTWAREEHFHGRNLRLFLL